MATATTPTANSITTSLGFTPAMKHGPQSNDHDCAFACIAMIAGKTLEEVRTTAIRLFRHPEHGPYYITETLINSLLAHYGWVSTVYKPVTSPISGLPDLAILMVDYDEERELGRHVVFHRLTSAGQKPAIEYVLDPGYWQPAEKQVQIDLKKLMPSWFIAVHPMNAPATYSKK